jgi:riboflavin synthase
MQSGTAVSVKFQISPETLRLTNLGDLIVGDTVNLERAMKVGQRFSGHMVRLLFSFLSKVQGHVDTTVTISSIQSDPPNSIIYTFTASDAQFLPYIVHKGYVCLDGTSLTVVSVDYASLSFKIMLIQYTQAHVIMPMKRVGDRVNLEVDQVGKYVESVVVGMMSSNPVIEGLIENIVKKIMNKSIE